MSANIHPTALVDASATIADDAVVGPWVIVGPNCTVGSGSVLQPHSVLEENVTIGQHVTVGIGTVLGGKPQDLKWQGEETFVEIGNHTTIREYSTINRATSQSWKTTVGEHCYIMSYVHLAHDCHVGNHVIMSNGTQLAGHVTIDDWAIISGLCAIHQFAKVGRHSFIGGCSRVAKDVPPFVKAVGNPIKLYGLNSVGLQRRGFSDETVSELKKAYRMFFRSDLNVSQALEQARQELKPSPEVQDLISFIETSGRGTTV
ncbi:MAG: acyl-ACP--UDP-N-acetylglucosamine O-acyltransferase [Gemmatimonadetes bacterium]|nr:acyl-ACP--UDP-N-acetylglucosamine O-acyltransferase [Gemmatimonadota bacterium]